MSTDDGKLDLNKLPENLRNSILRQVREITTLADDTGLTPVQGGPEPLVPNPIGPRIPGTMDNYASGGTYTKPDTGPGTYSRSDTYTKPDPKSRFDRLLGDLAADPAISDEMLDQMTQRLQKLSGVIRSREGG